MKNLHGVDWFVPPCSWVHFCKKHIPFESCVLSSIVVPWFSWLVCQGVAVWHPPRHPPRHPPKIQGVPPKIPPKRHPPMPPKGHWRGDALFDPPVDGTHRRLQSKRDGRSYWLVVFYAIYCLIGLPTPCPDFSPSTDGFYPQAPYLIQAIKVKL